jgi:hypothetical protein
LFVFSRLIFDLCDALSPFMLELCPPFFSPYINRLHDAVLALLKNKTKTKKLSRHDGADHPGAILTRLFWRERIRK